MVADRRQKSVHRRYFWRVDNTYTTRVGSRVARVPRARHPRDKWDVVVRLFKLLPAHTFRVFARRSQRALWNIRSFSLLPPLHFTRTRRPYACSGSTSVKFWKTLREEPVPAHCRFEIARTVAHKMSRNRGYFDCFDERVFNQPEINFSWTKTTR